ncbi:MAG: putative molybdenum carrier protein [Thermodesulfobacteriota bacterium]
MIKKIISGGQTGADQAALDVAIKLDIPHGGWVPKGRLTENGPLNPKYRVEEMITNGYNERTEQNVIDSDGTLIISHGKLFGGSAYTRDMALRHERPWLHVDLNKIAKFQAALKINAWIEENRIEILNVAGPRKSKDPSIYEAVMDLLESVYYLGLSSIKNPVFLKTPSLKQKIRKEENPPQTIEEAVSRLIVIMSLRDKATIANLTQAELPLLRSTLGIYIKNKILEWSSNPTLMKNCLMVSTQNTITYEDASLIIITRLWEHLRKNYKLRIVK